jgi:hypothetical protein
MGFSRTVQRAHRVRSGRAVLLAFGVACAYALASELAFGVDMPHYMLPAHT